MIPGVHRRAYGAFEFHGVRSPQLRLKVDGLAPIICSYYNNISELVNLCFAIIAHSQVANSGRLHCIGYNHQQLNQVQVHSIAEFLQQ